MTHIKRSKLDKIVQEEVKKALLEEGLSSKSTLGKEIEKVKREPHALNVGGRVKKEPGKVFSSELINNRLKAAGFDLQSGYTKKVKEIIHQFFLDYLKNKKIPPGQIEISALREYKFEEEGRRSLLQSLAAVPRIDGDKAPASVLRALVKDVEQQLNANAAIFDKHEQPGEENKPEPEEEADEYDFTLGSEDIKAEPEEKEPDIDTDGRAEPVETPDDARKEAALQRYSLKQALDLLDSDIFDVKEYIRKLIAYKSSSVRGIDGFVDGAIEADVGRFGVTAKEKGRAKEALLKINKEFKEKGLKPLSDAFDNAIEVLKSFYIKGGRADQLKESLDYSQLTKDGEEILLICLSPYLNNQPQTLSESYRRRSHLIGDKLMKKWNLNS
jgi:hypothetical protein